MKSKKYHAFMRWHRKWVDNHVVYDLVEWLSLIGLFFTVSNRFSISTATDNDTHLYRTIRLHACHDFRATVTNARQKIRTSPIRSEARPGARS